MLCERQPENSLVMLHIIYACSTVWTIKIFRWALMTLPNFVVIGASRSGTTSLYHHLTQHPQVYVTPVLEPRFFAFEGSSLNFCGPGDELLKKRIVTKLEDYLALFKGVTQETAIGEISPAYLSSTSAPSRIYHYIPHAKIIAVLRNPVERAISSFRLERLEGFEPLIDLAEALEQEETRMRNNWSYVWQYKGRGLYYMHLKRYFDIFPRNQIKVFLYEDWRNGGVELIKSVLQFLQVDETVGIPYSAVRHNSTDTFRFNSRGLERPEVSLELKAKLTEEYREEIEKLGELIDRDLSLWL